MSSDSCHKKGLSRFSWEIKFALTLYVIALLIALGFSGLAVQKSRLGEQAPWSDTGIFEAIIHHYSWSPLKSAASGSMSSYFDSATEQKVIIEWCDQGAPRRGFYEQVEPVLDKRCIRCHGAGGARGGVSLVHWMEVSPLASGHGPTTKVLLKQTHSHLFGFALIFGSLGILVSMTGGRRLTKILLIGLPFLAILLDVGGWWLARVSTAGGYCVVVGGGLIGLLSLFQIIFIIGDLWKLSFFNKR